MLGLGLSVAQVAVRSRAGAGVAAALRTPFVALNQYSRVSPDASTADFAPPSDFIDFQIEINLPTWAGHHIASRWGDPFGVSTCSLYLNVGTDGKMNLYKLDSAGNFAQVTSGVDLRTVLTPRQWVVLRWRLNSSGAAINGVAAGAAEFSYAVVPNNDPAFVPSTWTVLDTQTGLGTAGFNQFASKSFNIGTFAGNNDMIAGRVRRCSLKNKNGVALLNPDFTTLTVGKPATSSDDTFTDAAGKTWKLIDACIARDLGVLVDNTKMTRTSSYKLKSMMIVPVYGGIWEGFWNDKYNGPRLQAQLQDAKDLGCNAVKFFLAGWSALPPVNQIESFCGILRTLGMKVFLGVGNHGQDWCGQNGDQRNTIVPTLAAHIALWYQYGADVIAAFDIANETNLGDFTSPGWTSSGRTYADLAYFADKLREVAPTIPLSASLYQGAAGFGEDNLRYFMQWQSTLGFDFHDVHMYHGTGGSGSAGSIPDPADVLSVENASWFIGRHLNGECGLDYAVNNDTVLTNWITNFMIPNAQRSKSLGCNFFCDRNYEPTHYGIMNNAAEKAAITAGVLS